MAKIATAHIEIKPVLNDDSLQELMQRIEDAVAAGFERGMAAANRHAGPSRYGNPAGRTEAEVIDILNRHGHNLQK